MYVIQRTMSDEGKMPALEEYISRKGFLHYEDIPEYILCKPRLMPLKSVTLEKLENMQKEAEEKMKRQQMNLQKSWNISIAWNICVLIYG